MPETAILVEARRWVVENYPYNRDHLLRALEWLDRLAPGAPEAVRLAALTHDMERAFPGPDSPVMKSLADPVYEQLHSERSARIVSEWLASHGADEQLTRDVAALIIAHEVGGTREADLVQAADRLSFLFDRRRADEVRALVPSDSSARREGARAPALRGRRCPPRPARNPCGRSGMIGRV